jgi:hypothetical protein
VADISRKKRRHEEKQDEAGRKTRREDEQGKGEKGGAKYEKNRGQRGTYLKGIQHLQKPVAKQIANSGPSNSVSALATNSSISRIA